VFEQTSRFAEKVTTSVSRRGFLGSLGSWAAAAAMGVAGLLTGAGTTEAGKSGKAYICVYQNNTGTCSYCFEVDRCNSKACPPSFNGCPRVGCGRSGPTGCSSW
jgi:hypothetical protein